MAGLGGFCVAAAGIWRTPAVDLPGVIWVMIVGDEKPVVQRKAKVNSLTVVGRGGKRRRSCIDS